MGAASSQHSDKYDFLYGLPKDSSTYSNLDEYVLKSRAPLKSRSSSSLYILNVLNNFKGFTSSKSFFNDLKSFKRQGTKKREDDLQNNNYILLTPNQKKVFSKSMSLNSFRPENSFAIDGGRKGLYKGKEYESINEIREIKTKSKEKKSYTTKIQPADQTNRSISQLDVDFSRMNTSVFVTYDNQAYSSDKNSQLISSNNSQLFQQPPSNNNHLSQKPTTKKTYLSHLDRLNNNTILFKAGLPPNKETTSNIKHIDTKSQTKSTEVCSKQVLMQATTPELLLCLGGFLTQRFKHLEDFDCSKAISWMRNVDRSLLLQGWQDVVFISPANIVFVFLLINSEGSRQRISNVQGLQLLVLTCLYISYTYMGNEISYPSKPFLLDHVSKEAFWDRCLQIINSNSSNMLKINKDPSFFADNFSELKSYFKN